MPVMTASSLTYKVSLDEMKKLIAKDIGYPEEAIQVKYVLQDMADYDRGYASSSNYKVTGIEIIVDQVEAEKIKKRTNTTY